jgi:hypothetical protein
LALLLSFDSLTSLEESTIMPTKYSLSFRNGSRAASPLPSTATVIRFVALWPAPRLAKISSASCSSDVEIDELDDRKILTWNRPASSRNGTPFWFLTVTSIDTLGVSPNGTDRAPGMTSGLTLNPAPIRSAASSRRGSRRSAR